MTGRPQQPLQYQLRPQGSQPPQYILGQPHHSWPQAATQQQQRPQQQPNLLPHSMSAATSTRQQQQQMHVYANQLSSELLAGQPSGLSSLVHQASLPQQQWAMSASRTSFFPSQAILQPRHDMQQNSLQPPTLVSGVSQAFPQPFIQQNPQHQTPHLNMPTSSMGFSSSGLWPQHSITNQQPDLPIINTQGNPFAPPRAYLLDEEEDGQSKPDRSTPHDPENAQPASSQLHDPSSSAMGDPNSAAEPASPSLASQPSWLQFPQRPTPSSGQTAPASLGSSTISGWHHFDALQAGPSQIQQQQQEQQIVTAPQFTTGKPSAMQSPCPWHQLQDSHSSRKSGDTAASASFLKAAADHDAASSILGGLSRGQVCSSAHASILILHVRLLRMMLCKQAVRSIHENSCSWKPIQLKDGNNLEGACSNLMKMAAPSWN